MATRQRPEISTCSYQEVIEGLTGNTFTTLLMGVISDELSKGSTNNNAQRVASSHLPASLLRPQDSSLTLSTRLLQP